jgi:hypothetical protein
LRPFDFDTRDTLYGTKEWTVYEMLQDSIRAETLKQLDLGVVYDSEQNWLILVWPEAVDGILSDFERCPSWNKILKAEATRTKKEVPKSWWKTCASSHSYSVPSWRLTQDATLKNKLWHRIGLRASDIVAFDLNGVDFLMENGKLVFPVAKRAHFTHFYTEDRREIAVLQQHKTAVVGKDGQRVPDWGQASRRRLYENRKNAEKRAEHKAWTQAGKSIQRMASLLGTPIVGRHKVKLSGRESEELFARTVDTYLNAGVLREINWYKVDMWLDRLEPLLKDPTVPPEFAEWLKWRKHGDDLVV